MDRSLNAQSQREPRAREMERVPDGLEPSKQALRKPVGVWRLPGMMLLPELKPRVWL